MHSLKKNWLLHTALAVFVTGGVCSPAFSQIDIPSAADPSRIDSHEIPYSAPLQTLEPKPAADRVIPNIPQGMENLRFTLQDLDIIGLTAYSREEVAPLFNAYIGKTISVADLFSIMAALQQKYVDDGYTLTKVVIPNQNIQSGIAALEVIEGYVAKVEMQGDIALSPIIQDAISKIKSMRPLNTRRLERILLIINDLPDIDVSAVLAKLAENNPPVGAVRMLLQSNPSRDVRGKVSMDNYGSVFAGPWQGSAKAYVYNLGRNYTTTTVDLSATIPLSEQRYAALTYDIPVLGVSGTKVSIGGTTAWTKPGDSLRSLEVKGRTNNLNLGISYPLIRQRAQTCMIDARLEYKNSRTNLLEQHPIPRS